MILKRYRGWCFPEPASGPQAGSGRAPSSTVGRTLACGPSAAGCSLSFPCVFSVIGKGLAFRLRESVLDSPSPFPPPRGNEPPAGSPKSFVMDAVKPGYNRQARVVGAEVITARHRNIALLVAGCDFMEMLDDEHFLSMKLSRRSRPRNQIIAGLGGGQR